MLYSSQIVLAPLLTNVSLEIAFFNCRQLIIVHFDQSIFEIMVKTFYSSQKKLALIDMRRQPSAAQSGQDHFDMFHVRLEVKVLRIYHYWPLPLPLAILTIADANE